MYHYHLSSSILCHHLSSINIYQHLSSSNIMYHHLSLSLIHLPVRVRQRSISITWWMTSATASAAASKVNRPSIVKVHSPIKVNCSWNRIRRLATGGIIHQAWFWSLIKIYRIAHCNLHTYNRFIQFSVYIITVNLLHQTYKFKLC